MIIKEVKARKILNSRRESTIQLIIKTKKGRFKTSAPSGKSRGRYEVKPYAKNLKTDISSINKLDIETLNKLNISVFSDLKKIEKLVKNKIGANSLFALEASLLKALARENRKELWEFLGGRKRLFSKKDAGKKFRLQSVGNAVGGGMHSKGIKGKKPDFQEFLFISDYKIDKKAYRLVGGLLRARKRNDEGAWETSLDNEKVLEVMDKVREKIGGRINIGLDIAGSSFYKNGRYIYKNPAQKLNRNEQINYIRELVSRYKILYVEDGLNENDFAGFRELRNKAKGCLIVGDDLIVTNPERLKKAIRMKSVNAVIVKPNQIGSLLKVKEVVEISKRHGIKTIMSHRSGETKDNTIADLAVGFGCDFIKTGIYGSVRESKLKRLVEIRGRL